MAKVIEQGYERIKCYKCKSLIEYEHREVQVGKFNSDYLGDYDLLEFIICPSCNTDLIIRKSL